MGEPAKTRINTTIIVEIQNADEIKHLMDKQHEILLALRDNFDEICAARLRLVANAQPSAGTDGRDQSDYVVSAPHISDVAIDTFLSLIQEVSEGKQTLNQARMKLGLKPLDSESANALCVLVPKKE